MAHEVHHHEVGDQIRIGPHSPPERVLARFHGGFGAVYIVESTDPLQPGISALKTVRRDRMTPETLNRFHDEAAIWANLPHSVSILPAYSVRRYNDLPYVRTKYVPAVANCAGPSVEHLIGRFVVNAGVLSAILVQVAGAMAALQAEDPHFSHGDLKPANILLDRIPDEAAPSPSTEMSIFPYLALVSDFGLARAFYTRDDRGLRGGDLRYIAPEVLGREDCNPVLADIYSFGAAAVHMFLNRPIRSGEPDHGMSLDEVSRALAEQRPEVPREVQRLIQACLEADPGNRPDGFSAIASQLAEHSPSMGVRLEPVIIPNRSSGSAWLDDSTKNSPVKEHLQSRRGLSEPEASNIVSWLSEAASLRASSRIAEAKELTDRVLGRLPGFPPALAGEAHGCTLEGRPKRAVNLYLMALHGYIKDQELTDADAEGFAGACSTLAQNVARVWLELTPEERGKLGEPARQYARLGRIRSQNEARSWLSEGMAELIIGNDLDAASKLLERGHEIDPSNRAIRQYVMVTRLLGEQVRASGRLDPEKVMGWIGELELTEKEMAAVTGMIELTGKAFGLRRSPDTATE